MLGRSNCTLSTPSGNVSLVRMASLADIPHLGPKGLPCIQMQLDGQIDLVPEVAPMFAFHLRDSHVQNRANPAILNRLTQHEICPHFEGLAERGSTAYDCEHHGPLVRGVRRYASKRFFPPRHF